MSNLSELLPAGAGAKSADFVASGTLGSGVTVVLKADGTVEAVAVGGPESTTPVTATPSTDSGFLSSAYHTAENKIVLYYRDSNNNYYATAIVGTVSGTSISFGTAVVVQTTVYYGGLIVLYDSLNTKLVFLMATSGYMYGKVGTLSGTSISLGALATSGVVSGSTETLAAAYDSNLGKVILGTRQSGNNYGISVVGTVSGTSISFGTNVIFNSASTYDIAISYDETNQKVGVFYRVGGTFYGKVGTVSGTSISFGAQSSGLSGTPAYAASTYDTNAGKIVVAYSKNTETNAPYCVIATISGTSLTFGSPVQINAARSEFNAISYDSIAQKVVVTSYIYDGSPQTVAGTVSGTTISYGEIITLAPSSAATSYAPVASAYDSSANKTIVSTIVNTSGVSSIAYSPTSTNSADFIGITDQAIADTATGAVIVQGGVSEKAKGPITSSVGTATTFSASLAPLSSIVYDEANKKVVVVYRDNSNSQYGTAKVGTVSGTSISWGTPTVFQSGGLSPSEAPQATYDPDTEQIIAAYLVGNVGRYAVGSVSGTTISFGSSGAFETGNTTWISLAYDTANSRVVIAYRYNTAPATDDGYAVVGTVSGTSISFGSRVLFDGGSVSYTSTVYDSNAGKIVIVYNSSGAKAVVGTVSGTSISFGSIATITMTLPNMTYSDLVYDAGSQKVVFVTRESLTPFYGLALVGTVSGTSISFGTEVEFTADGINWMAATYDSTLGKTIICYEEQTDIGKFVLGTVSGTSISFTSPEIFNASATDNVRGATYDSNQQAVVVTFTLTSAPYYGRATAISLTAPLAPNTDYYVQADGTLSTTISSVPAGRALSTTSILLEG